MADANQPAASPARLRAEARKQKILSQGNDRLAKITGAMKNRSESGGDNLKSQTLDTDEPPEVDISKVDTMGNQRTDLPRQRTIASSSSSLNLHSSANDKEMGNQKKSTKPSQSAVFPDQPSMNSSMPPNAADPMLQMMKAMGLELPNPSGSGPDGMFGSDEGPNAMMQQAFAGLSGMQPPVEKTRADRIFPLLNILTVVCLILSATLWWNPMSNYWRQIQPFGSFNEQDSNVDLRAEWEALHPPGSTPAVRQALGPAPVFWMFITIELMLQATRWMFNRNVGSSPGLLNTLIHSLPRPYSTLASTVLKYFAIIGSLIDDLFILLFGVGCAVIWLEWKHLPDHSFFGLVQPN